MVARDLSPWALSPWVVWAENLRCQRLKDCSGPADICRMTSVASKRGRGPRYTSLAVAAAGVLTVLAVLLGLSLVSLSRAVADQRRASAEQVELGGLAGKLGGASDLLTNEARAYSVTGDKAHLDAYWHEIDVTKTRDEVIARLKQLGVQQDLFDLLAKAKANSDALVKTETRSQRLMLDASGVAAADMPKPVAEWQLSAQDVALPVAAKKATSARIMFDDQYTKDKALIMDPVGQFNTLLTQRAQAKVDAAAAATSTATRWLVILAVLTVLA